MGEGLPAVLKGVFCRLFLVFLLFLVSFFLQIIVVLGKVHTATGQKGQGDEKKNGYFIKTIYQRAPLA